MTERQSAEKSLRVSLNEANRLQPDDAFDSTASNLMDLYGIAVEDRCLTLERIALSAIDPDQRMDDPDAIESLKKIEAMRTSIRAGEKLPPVYVAHHPGDRFPYFLLEGMHRFSSYLIEGKAEFAAWVAHPGCCISEIGAASND